MSINAISTTAPTSPSGDALFPINFDGQDASINWASDTVARPTNTWWINFMYGLDDGANYYPSSVNSHPYLIRRRLVKKGLELFIPYREETVNKVEMKVSSSHLWHLSLGFTQSSSPNFGFQKISGKKLTTIWRYTHATGTAYWDAYVNQGSPYVTGKYTSLNPSILSGGIVYKSTVSTLDSSNTEKNFSTSFITDQTTVSVNQTGNKFKVKLLSALLQSSDTNYGYTNTATTAQATGNGWVVNMDVTLKPCLSTSPGAGTYYISFVQINKTTGFTVGTDGTLPTTITFSQTASNPATIIMFQQEWIAYVVDFTTNSQPTKTFGFSRDGLSSGSSGGTMRVANLSTSYSGQYYEYTQSAWESILDSNRLANIVDEGIDITEDSKYVYKKLTFIRSDIFPNHKNIIGVLPHNYQANTGGTIALQPNDSNGDVTSLNSSVRFKQIKGWMKYYHGTNFVYRYRKPRYIIDYNTTGWTDAEKQAVITQINTDSAVTQSNSDSYFSGVKMFSIAETANLAHKLGQTTARNTMITTLITSLDNYFGRLYYSPTWWSIITDRGVNISVYDNKNYLTGIYITRTVGDITMPAIGGTFTQTLNTARSMSTEVISPNLNQGIYSYIGVTGQVQLTNKPSSGTLCTFTNLSITPGTVILDNTNVPTFDYNEFNDYGNSLITDHHYHYGYVIATSAILVRLEKIIKQANPSYTEYFSDSSKVSKINQLIRDIANPNTSDTYFPLMRVKDIMTDHSFAGGLGNGSTVGGQETSSECLNGFYGIMWWGMLTNNESIRRIGEYYVSTELLSREFYWQITGKDIYGSVYENANVHARQLGVYIDNVTYSRREISASDRFSVSTGLHTLPSSIWQQEWCNSEWIAKLLTHSLYASSNTADTPDGQSKNAILSARSNYTSAVTQINAITELNDPNGVTRLRTSPTKSQAMALVLNNKANTNSSN